jgi:GNAT superfamily N-acetyltransferase
MWTLPCPIVLLREAQPDDLQEICKLIDELAAYEHLQDEVAFDPEQVQRKLFGPDPAARVLLAITEHDEVAGMALWYRTFSTFLGSDGIWLEDLFVRPEHRNRGYGRALLTRLRELTDGRVEWAVLDWNTPAIDFYRKLGASPVEGWTRYRWLR